MIVDCAIYQDGRREDVDGDLSDALDRARARGQGFLWIGLHEPTEEEFALVSQELRLHPLAIEDAVHAHQRPKVERYDDVLFLVLKTLRYIDETSSVDTGEIMVFVGRDFVITVRHGQANPLGEVRRRLEKDPALLGSGPTAVLYAVCDAVVDTYMTIADEIHADINDLEARVFSPGRENVAEAIYSLKREVLEFRAAVVPFAPVAHDLVSGRFRMPRETSPFFRDVADHVLRVSGTVESFDELLTSVLNAHLTQVSVQQNEDMRRISAWVAILAVPTMIAGIYGMNFRYMPELSWKYGYPGVLIVMVVVCVVLYVRFRKSGWL